MNIAFFIAHPSQYYLFKETARNISKYNEVFLIYFEKDIVGELVRDENYGLRTFCISAPPKIGKFGFINSFIKKDFELFKILKINKIDLIVGTSIAIAHAAKLVGAKSIIFTEDDVSVIAMSAKLGYPFVNHIVSPTVCNLEGWEHKSIKYNGYQKLAYLHPNIFKADPDIIKKYTNNSANYFLIRFSGLSAHHDIGISGFSKEIAFELIRKLSQHGRVFISSENKLEKEFASYQLKIKSIDIHHILAGARLLVSDSQSMSVEAAMLGVPSIRISDFVGRISVLEELENKYKLTFGLLPSDEKKVFNLADELLSTSLDIFQARRKRMLSEKIDVRNFITELIGNYPHSLSDYKESKTKII